MICFTLLCVAASALAFVNPTISSDAQYLTPNADDSNLLPNELNVANLVVEDIPADSSAIRCTSDVLEDPSDNIKTRRSIGICPTLNNDHDTVQPSGTKSPTTTQQNPCTKEYYSHWVSCGGEELFYKYPKGAIDGVLNCVPASQSTIKKRSIFIATTHVADYCCAGFDDTDPLYMSFECFKMTPDIEIDPMSIEDFVLLLRQLRLPVPSNLPRLPYRWN